MAVLDKAAILAAEDLKRETVSVPEWGGDVIVREMSAKERDQFAAPFAGTDPKGEDLVDVRVKLVALTVVDESGDRIFSDNEIEQLGKKSSKVVDRLFNTAMELSGLADEGEEEASPKAA